VVLDAFEEKFFRCFMYAACTLRPRVPSLWIHCSRSCSWLAIFDLGARGDRITRSVHISALLEALSVSESESDKKRQV